MAITKTQREGLIVVVLLVTLGFLFWHQTRAAQAPSLPPTPPAAPPMPTTPAILEPAMEPAAEPVKAPETQLPMRDPFQRPAALEQLLQPVGSSVGTPQAPVVVPPPMPSLQLQGIFWNTQPHRAIVNNQIITEGDMIGGVTVVAIQPEGVTVEYQGNQTVLRLPTPGTARSPRPGRDTLY